MDREKMMELWREQFEGNFYNWQLTPEVYDYLEGKTDQVPENIIVGSKYHVYYNDWMVNELDGENSELARRMLLVISKNRFQGIIYKLFEDVKICLRIGYDFDSIVNQSVVKYPQINAVSTYWIAHELMEHRPADAEKFAGRLLSPESLEQLISKREKTRELYLALYLAVELLKKDASAYNRYLPVIEDVSQRVGGEYIVIMLYEAHQFSPVLKENLSKQLTTNSQAAKVILNLTGAKDMIAYLDSIGAPRWPYYYQVIVEGIPNVSKSETINKLYKEDKETFMQLYQQLSGSNSQKEFMYAPYLLAIMLKSGDNQADPDSFNTKLPALLKQLFTEYANNKKTGLPDKADLANEAIPIAGLASQLKINRRFGWGIPQTIFGAFAVLYDYSSRSRRFMHLLLSKAIKDISGYDNRSYLAGSFIYARNNWLDIPPVSSLNTLLASEADFDVADTLVLYCFAQTSWRKIEEVISPLATPEFIKQHQEEALSLLGSGRLDIDQTIIWTDLLYIECKLDDYSPLIPMLGSKSKLVRKNAEELIADNEEQVRPLLEDSLPKLKGEALAAAKRLIKKWDNERKFGANFTFTDNNMIIDFCSDNYDPNSQKFISWIPEEMCAGVQFADLSDKAPAAVMQYILSEYMSLEEPYKIKACDKIIECLHPQDFQSAMENIYRLWKDTGAEAKKKMVMVPYCIYASDSQILRLKTQLKDWAEASRGAIAAFVVNAIAMNGGSVALMMLDGISVKFPNNQVKNAAKAAFSFAAKALEIPEDELSDKIVPTLGFNKEGEKELDYGARTFKVTLMPNFSLTIFDNDKQKVIKSMPAPAAGDDTVKATAAKKEFSELKKQIKATVQSQTNRLEKVLMNGRCWTATAWNTLFVENPIMHRFATGLIWGVYKDKELTDTFRYMDDGTFNTVDEEEYALPHDAQISLVHPIELPAETVSQWQEQLDDYEVVQPFAQLSLPIVTLEDKDVTNKKVTRYMGTIAKSGKISGMAKKYNLVRGEVLDGGSYTLFHWVDKYLGIAAQLNFEYMYMGQDYNDDVPLEEVIFYRLNENGEVVEDPQANIILEPSEVPARFVSTVIGTFDGLKD